MIEIDVVDECTGAYSGQSDHRLIALRKSDGVQVGFIEYAVYRREPSISMIRVDPGSERQGVATGMLRALQAAYPACEIGWGLMTPDGLALKVAVTRTVPNEHHRRLSASLQRVQARIADLALATEALQQASRSGPEWDLWRIDLGAAWNQAHDQEYELEEAMRDVRPVSCWVDMGVDPAIERSQQARRWIEAQEETLALPSPCGAPSAP